MGDLAQLRAKLGERTDAPPDRWLVASPEVAAQLGLVEGDRYGAAEVVIDEYVPPGMLGVLMKPPEDGPWIGGER